MSNMTMTVNAVQIRFGQIDEGGQLWANLHVIEDEFQVKEGFAGVDIGKMAIDTKNGNELAKKMHAAAIHSKCLPGPLVLEIEPQFSLKQTKLVIVGFSVPGQKAA